MHDPLEQDRARVLVARWYRLGADLAERLATPVPAAALGTGRGFSAALELGYRCRVRRGVDRGFASHRATLRVGAAPTPGVEALCAEPERGRHDRLGVAECRGGGALVSESVAALDGPHPSGIALWSGASTARAEPMGL